ncbi:alpha/beta hydrolase [Corynebacterium auriscanis]|uniref:alpha/beta hydrolase n=1 Tax=Corynebacterium auriscanis TaxID=99807 RepID=UPI0022462245|nr:alpha/beta hydrolase family protein [Corynebacterium auriscanis]MCX2162631.1 esterase family protein [Corynebacterium auriscanis]
MKRPLIRIGATGLAIAASIAPAAAAPAAFAEPAPAAAASTPAKITRVPALTEKQKADDSTAKWRKIIAEYNSHDYDNVFETTAYSPSMDRNIPVVVIQPYDKAKRKNAPTLYMLNGADGGEGAANWLAQSDVVTYYGGNRGNFKNVDKSPGIGANIVIPMAGKYSYYTDWQKSVPQLQGGSKKPQKWETFLTKELPQSIEPFLGANGKRGIAGLSMAATSVLNLAQHNPGFYDTVGSFSGCAATTTGAAPDLINITLNRGGTSINDMWGGRNTALARYNDPQLNVAKLKNQKNMYISNGSGIAGPHDLLGSERVGKNSSASATVIVEGGVIEAATNWCTHEFRARTRALGIPVTYNFRPTGTHQWGYWQDDMRDFWPVATKGLGTNVARPAEPHQSAGGDLAGSIAQITGSAPARR